MKKILLTLLLLFMALLPLACTKPIFLPPIPAPPFTPTFTPTVTSTSTPVCVNYIPTTTFGGGVTYTLNPMETPVAFPYINRTFVIQDLTEWQALFGSTPVPTGLDFTSQMVVGANLIKFCGLGDDLIGVCEDSTQVTVNILRSTAVPYCNFTVSNFEMVIVPKSSLPVAWLYF